MAVLARLSRVVPLLGILAALGIIVYLVASMRYTSPRAKEIVLKMFTWVFAAISIFFALACLYALIEHNIAVLELMATFMGTGLVGLGITRWCNHIFLKNNPSFRNKPAKATVHRWPWQK